jgi:hypothetical protein
MAKKFLSTLKIVNLPSDPISGSEGELYFNTSASVAKVYQAGAWSVLGAGAGGGTTVSTTEPPSPEIGDSWYKNDTGEFYVYDGTYWVEVNGVIEGESNLYTLSDVTITNPTNNEVLAYDSSGSIWINQTASETGLLTEESASSTYLTQLSASMNYLTSDDAIMLYQPISVRLFNLTGLENVEGFLRTDGGLGWGVDTATYLTTWSASSTYLTQADASSVYLTQTNAANTYLTPATSASIYQPLDADLTTIAALSGSSGFLKKNIFDNWVIDSNTYLTTYDASTLYQTTGDYATISGVETLSNKTMSSAFIDGTLTFNDIDHDHTISSASNNFTINAYQNLYLTTTTGSIVLQPDEFVKIYDEHVATQEWVDFQDYLTQVSASTIYQPIGSYSTTSHNHTLDSLSNVVITGTPSDGQAIVWDTSTSKWVNETIASGSSYPDQTGNNGKFLQTNGASVSWQNVDLSSKQNYSVVLDTLGSSYVSLGEGSGFLKYTRGFLGSSPTWSLDTATYLTSYTETSTLEDVTDRGATSSNAITISNTTEATNATTGALIVSGGVGVAKDLWIDGNLHVAGTTTTENTKTVATHDNLIYLNAALDSTITNAVYSSGSIIYTADNLYVAEMDIRITGVSPSAFNISSGDLLTVASATPTQFVVIKSDPGASYISGGTAHAKEEADPDLGFSGGYYDAGYAHAGLFRDASDGVFKFFQGYTPEPDEAVNIDTTHASFAFADIQIRNIKPQGSGQNDNFGIGYNATFNATGFANFGIGQNAFSGGSGTNNFAIGDNSLENNTGGRNFAFGGSALTNNTGDYNYAIGKDSLQNNSGWDNYSIGPALYGNTGDWNYAVGTNSLQSNTGDYNFAFGYQAGLNNTGSYNVYIGKSEGLSTSNNIVIADNEGNIRAQYLSASSGWTLGTVVSGTWNGSAIGYQYGGTGLTSLGSAGYVLAVNATVDGLEWVEITGGGSSFTNSSELAALLSDETGSGSVVFSNSPTLTTPNIGAATGTSLTTTGNVISHVDISTPTFVTNSYTITSTDDGKLLMLNNSTTAGNLLIPTDATFNFPIGTQINIVQAGTGLITVAAVTPATTTVNATPGKKLRAQWSSAAIVKTAANTWLLMGDLTV